MRHLRESTVSGLEDQSWHPSVHSNRCGSQRASVMNLVLQLFTGSAFKLGLQFLVDTYGIRSEFDHSVGWLAVLRKTMRVICEIYVPVLAGSVAIYFFCFY